MCSLYSFPRPETGFEDYLEKVNSYYHFRVHSVSATLGYVLPRVATEFRKFKDWELDDQKTPKMLTLVGGHDEASRSAVVGKTISNMVENKTFGILKKLKEELKPIYGPGGELLFSIDRAAFPLLGIVAYGVHMVAYTRDAKGDVDKLWVSKRGEYTGSYVGFFDNTVSGGMRTGETPREALIREAGEEAELSSSDLANVKPCGTLSYFHIRKPEQGLDPGLLHPGVQYLYEMVVSEDYDPIPDNNEVESFHQLGCKEILEHIMDGKVKPIFTLVAIDFLLRHGAIDEKEERDFVEISMRLHRSLEFPVSHVL
jgi:8-oxo-dGTP pyrophosphatase MutT (NUDIX family)